MSGTVYLAASGRRQLDELQATVNAHLRINVAGRCLTCGAPSPCPALGAAHASFARYGRLPQRTPGITARSLCTEHE
jgi:hypothetical protein